VNTLGGAYAVLAYVSQQAVGVYVWITQTDVVTGLGLAETTPGPLIMVVQFVGFLAAYNHAGALPPRLAGMIGACLTEWVTFLPCFFFFFILIGAPYVERLRHSLARRHALAGIGAAVGGVIVNLAVWFALSTAFGTDTITGWGPVHVWVPDWSTVQWSSLAITALAVVLVFPSGSPLCAFWPSAHRRRRRRPHWTHLSNPNSPESHPKPGDAGPFGRCGVHRTGASAGCCGPTP
jgi:chromate transporter